VGRLIWRRVPLIVVCLAVVLTGTIAAGTAIMLGSPSQPAAPVAAVDPVVHLPVIYGSGVPASSVGQPALVRIPCPCGRTFQTFQPPAAPVAARDSLRQIVLPDLLVILPRGFTAAQLAGIRKLGGVREALPVSGGAIKIRGKAANVLGVSPDQFRSWTPPGTAANQAVWTALARGEFVATSAARQRLGLRTGTAYQMAGASQPAVTFGAAAPFGLPGVDAVVNSQTSGTLGLVPDVAVLISAPGDRLSALIAKARGVTGAQAQILSLRPAAPPKLPVGGSVPAGRPTTYLALYQASAAQFCPGLSWTVLAAIGQIESGNGQNVGPSSAGALGPMQFLPSTWQIWGIDAFGETGPPNIMDPFDAVPAAARYLCAAGADQGGTSLNQAIFAYNHADWYVNEVLALAAQYAQAYG
jgi:hypothetical protein